jgi:DHA2 family multidrug resistance protein
VRSLLVAAAGLVSLLIAFDQVSSWGWGSPGFLGMILLGGALLTWFVRLELAAEHPLLEMRMFTIDTFSITILIVWLITAAQFARLVFMPLDLQLVFGLTPLQAGLLLAPAAVGAAITMPLGGRMADRIGARLPVVTGLVMIAIATWLLGHLSVTTSLSWIVFVFVVQGLGTGLAMMPNTVAAMNALPTKYVARGSAVRSLNRQVAGSLSVAALASVVAAQVGTVGGGPGVSGTALQGAYNDAFLVAFIGVAIAAVLALRLPDRKRTLEDQAARAKEYAEIETA